MRISFFLYLDFSFPALPIPPPFICQESVISPAHPHRHRIEITVKTRTFGKSEEEKRKMDTFVKSVFRKKSLDICVTEKEKIKENRHKET